MVREEIVHRPAGAGRNRGGQITLASVGERMILRV